MIVYRWGAASLLIILALACVAPSTPMPTSTPQPILTTNTPAPSALPASGSGEIVFSNGTILTMDDSQPQAQAILIRDGLIAAVGSSSAVLAQAGPQAQKIDLQGYVIVPGFIDSHSHRITERGMEAAGYPNLEAIIPDILAQGWTTIDELYADEHRLTVLRGLDEGGLLRVRVTAYLPVNSLEGNPFGEWYNAYHPEQMVSPLVRVAGLKVFIDFDWGQILTWRQDDLNVFLLERQRQGWQLAVKTISTKSMEMALSAFEYIQQAEPTAQTRGRLEHALSITPQQIERIQRLALIPSVQTNMPGELTGDPEFYAFVEKEPPGAITPWRSLVEANIVIANGSAWPSYYADEPAGAPFGSPMRLIYQAVTRTGNLGAQPDPWMLDQTITAEQALSALTINGAYATFEEDSKGSISPGKLADLVILSADPLSVPTEQIPFIQVWMTMVGGRVEWCAPDAQSLCPTSIATAPATTLLVPAGQPIHIAVVGPSSGKHAAFLPAMLESAQIAVGDHGPVHGFDIVLEPFDDACDEERGAQAANTIIGDGGFAAMLGPLCSVSARGGLPVYEGASLPIVSPGATDPALPSLGPTVFNRVILNTEQLAAWGREESYIDALPAVQAFYATYQRRTGSAPPELYRHFLAYGYDAMGILIDALVRVAEVQADGSLLIKRDLLAQAIRATSGYEGVTGQITFDADGNRVP